MCSCEDSRARGVLAVHPYVSCAAIKYVSAKQIYDTGSRGYFSQPLCRYLRSYLAKRDTLSTCRRTSAFHRHRSYVVRIFPVRTIIVSSRDPAWSRRSDKSVQRRVRFSPLARQLGRSSPPLTVTEEILLLLCMHARTAAAIGPVESVTKNHRCNL